MNSKTEQPMELSENQSQTNTNVLRHINQKTLSTQSFDIIDETPKTGNTSQSFENILTETDDDVKLDEELENSFVNVPCNSPAFSSPDHDDNYSVKQNQISQILKTLKDAKTRDKKTKHEITALTRHLEKLCYAEKQGVKFEDYKQNIVNSYKLNKNTNEVLKNMYLNNDS